MTNWRKINNFRADPRHWTFFKYVMAIMFFIGLIENDVFEDTLKIRGI